MNTIYAVKLYFKDKQEPTVVQFYKRKGNAENRAKNAVLFKGYEKAEICLMNGVYYLEDGFLLKSYRKDYKTHQIVINTDFRMNV